MDKLNAIIKPVEKEIEAFNRMFKDALHGHSRDFQTMIDFISTQNGKRIRPLLTLLSARLCGEINQKSIDFALIIELLHTATLIHDDVVDNTLERRSQPSVNAKYDNRVAVLLGDYILALAITRAVMTQNLDIMAIIARVAKHLADGELTQMILSRELIIDEDRYFDVIHKKTAVLLAACGEIGAISVNADVETCEKLRLITENTGLCFQLRDDIFDYFEQDEIGKPTGNDIREGKITLPLLHALKTAPKDVSDKMHKLIRQKDFSRENILQLTDFAKTYKGIEYTKARMQKIKEETLTLLYDFPDSDAKTAMTELIDYIINRKK
ncbi:MAG: polyprenyl synthetase family protein [Dysgonamonadaceae bacterium]|jgi:octaprenyl-diphosphate synthase|nr:polyprenyl synthetase family protein [Dysgonamonadaceae bacterium]